MSKQTETGKSEFTMKGTKLLLVAGIKRKPSDPKPNGIVSREIFPEPITVGTGESIPVSPIKLKAEK